MSNDVNKIQEPSVAACHTTCQNDSVEVCPEATPTAEVAPYRNVASDESNVVHEAGPALKHGAYSFRATGLLPPGHEEIGGQLDALMAGYLADLGGGSEVGTGQQELLRLLRTTAGMRLLVERDIAERGWKTQKGYVRSQVKLLLSLVEREMALLKVIGLKRVARRVPSIEEYITAKRAAEQPTPGA